MEVIGWKPLDLIVGGMLTAGVAFGVYKFGRIGIKRAGATTSTELDSTNLQECIALAGRPSELEVSVLPQPDARCRRLAVSLEQSIQLAATPGNDEIVRHFIHDDGSRQSASEVNTLRRSFFKHLCAETNRDIREIFEKDRLCSPPDNSPPRRLRFRADPFYSPLMVDRTPPELTRQLQSYRDTLDKWTADSEAKIEKIEQQRMSLATELHVTREALQIERRHRAEAEQRRQRAESELQELEVRLQKCLETQGEVSRWEEEVKRLEQQVREMEEQLEVLYMHNVVTPRQAVQENVVQHELLSKNLQQAEDELQRQEHDMQELENEVINLSTQLNKTRKDARKLGEDNTMIQKQMHEAHQAARDLVALLFERSAGREGNTTELTELLNAPDKDLPLAKLLSCITTLILHT